jgi:transposase
MTELNLTADQLSKVSARMTREVEEWLRDKTVEPHYSVETLAELLEVDQRAVERYIALGKSSNGREGIHPVCRLSFKTMRIPASSVNRFLQRCTIAAPSAVELSA